MASKLRAILFLGSTREGRNGERVAAFVKKELESQGFTLKTFDAKAMPFPLLEKPLHHYPDPTKAPKFLQEANEEIKKADAFVFLTCEYNRAPPPGLINMLDHFSPASYGWKSVLLVSYSMGPHGGVTAANSLLPLVRELGLFATPSPVAIPTVHQALSADGQLQTGFDYVKKGMDLAASQLSFTAHAFKEAREGPAPKVHTFL